MDSKSIIITQGTEFLQLQDGVDIGQQTEFETESIKFQEFEILSFKTN